MISHPARTRRSRRASLLAVLAVLAVLSSACTAEPVASGDDEPAAPASPSPSPSPTPSPSPRRSASPSPSESASDAEPATSESETEPAPGPSASPSEAAGGVPPSAAPAAPGVLAGTEGLAEGGQGEAVARLQQRLTEAGYKTGAADGSFGRRTAVAVRAFQSDHGLPPSGQVDAATVAALEAAPPGVVLGPGSTGEQVAALQQQLNDGPFDAGPVDGEYGTRTVQAVYALQKLHGYPIDGQFSAVERYLLASGEGLLPRLSGEQQGTQVEINIGAQLVRVYTNGQLALATHTSTASGETFCTPAGGCRRAVTPKGSYVISRRIDGWRTAELGRLYNPLYFNGGIALHGSESIPTSPASHGCVRLPMHIAEYAPDLLPNGTPVIVA